MTVEQLPESLNEFFDKLQPLGTISTLISRTIKAILQPNETVLLSFFQLEMSENMGEEEQAKGPTLGSCEVKLVSTHRFIVLGFYPTYHHINLKPVYKISNFDMNNRFSTGYEGEGEVTTAEERGYNPKEIQLELRFSDENGQEVCEWIQDASRPEDIKTLYKQLPLISRLVGKPLAECV